jgi:5-methyltetrahydrofolate--homocysteine methyltransferase
MEDVFPFLNERTLFSTQWQFRKNNVKPAEYERLMKEVAQPALARLKQQCVEENILRPAAVYGFFRCASHGDDLIIYEEDGRTERLHFTFPRQPDGERLCLSDYFRPADEPTSPDRKGGVARGQNPSLTVGASGAGEGQGGGATDIVALFIVTVGHEVSRRTQQLFAANRYTDYLYLHGLGVESAEALAEFFHKRIRQEWGIGNEDAPEIQKLFKLHYRGCRYSFGYPACPSLEDQAKLFELLQPERIGVTLSEHFQLEPEQSTSALVVHHPAAKYFNVRACAEVG